MKSKTETTWRCIRRVADSYHVILKTTKDEVSTLAKPHNNSSDKTTVEIEKCRQIMKQANSTNDRPNQILTFSTATAVCEGWNNKFHSLVGHSHPTIWKLIETLQVEANRIASILLQSDRGIRQKKRTKRIHTELQTRLKNMCKNRLQTRKSIAEFLHGVSLNIRGGQPHI